MSHIRAYNSRDGSRPYDPFRIDVMLNPHKYGMSSYSDSQYNTMLGARADNLYYSNTNYSANSNSSSSSSCSSSSRSSSSGALSVRSGEFCSYGLWH